MKTSFRFLIVGVFMIGLGAHASQPTETPRPPVILKFYQSIHHAMKNGPAVVLASGVSLVIGVGRSAPGRNSSDDLWLNVFFPMAGTFLTTLLVGDYFLHANT